MTAPRPLYGHWYLGEASKRKKEEPPADHPIRDIWRLWVQARIEPDEEQRNALFQQLLDIHKAHPCQIGTVGEGTTIVIVSKTCTTCPTATSMTIRCAVRAPTGWRIAPLAVRPDGFGPAVSCALQSLRLTKGDPFVSLYRAANPDRCLNHGRHLGCRLPHH